MSAVQSCSECAPLSCPHEVVAPVGSVWEAFEARSRGFCNHFSHEFKLRQFEYRQPKRLQKGVPLRLRKLYSVPVAYTEWGEPGQPVVVCCGGVANTAMRFSFLASELRSTHRVICMDWLGRGLSGWLADEREYHQATHVEQLRQMILHLGCGAVTVLGSSLGGSAAIELAARYPRLVKRLILNDIGPFIPRKRRRRRAETLARFYVFRHPDEMARRVGASQKNDGPISDEIRSYISFHQTRWSDEDQGRIYRYDMRAMQAYRRDAQGDLDQWDLWPRVKCPVLLIHGLQSDALLPPTIERMLRVRPLTVMHVPDTGHTPVLSDRNQVFFIRQWLHGGELAAGEWTVLHEPPRRPVAEAASDATSLPSERGLSRQAVVQFAVG